MAEQSRPMSRRSVPVSPMYRALARYYDRVYQAKDYAREVRDLERVVRAEGPRPARDWLDVACGTGRHLAVLRRRYRVVGVDASAAMLQVARRRLPGVRLVRGDMRRFDLRRRFDVVSCLFSAIGYVRTGPELARTFRTFARHLRPGGLLLVEPWVSPSDFRPGHVAVDVARGPDGFVVRAGISRRRGRLSFIDFQYLIAEEGGRIRHLEETETLRLSSEAELLRAARRAGLDARFRPLPRWRSRRGRRSWLVARAPVER